MSLIRPGSFMGIKPVRKPMWVLVASGIVYLSSQRKHVMYVLYVLLDATAQGAFKHLCYWQTTKPCWLPASGRSTR